jgi:RimJ/RimL family protein N-acetyltransferase
VNVHLETERLILRRFTPGDAANLFELDNDPEVMRYLTGGSGTSMESVEREILPEFLSWHARSANFGYWAAIDKSTGGFIGWFLFRPERGGTFTEPELGYRLRKDAWGKGFATEGSRALIDNGFAQLGVERIHAMTYQDNVASRRVMEKLGMRHVSSHRYTPDEMREHFGVTAPELFPGEDVEYAITRDEWAAQRAANASPSEKG